MEREERMLDFYLVTNALVFWILWPSEQIDSIDVVTIIPGSDDDIPMNAGHESSLYEIKSTVDKQEATVLQK